MIDVKEVMILKLYLVQKGTTLNCCVVKDFTGKQIRFPKRTNETIH